MGYPVFMRWTRALLNLAVAAFLALATFSGAAQAQDGLARPAVPDVEALLQELARPDQNRWRRIEQQILRAWARSGSASVDYIFLRGQLALRAGQMEAAIDHFSAVIDHAPSFAEGWNARATAHFMSNRLGQSLADIEQVLALNPRHFGALSGLGSILEQLDRPEDARAAYAAAQAIHPHRPNLREALERLDLALAGRAL